MTRRVVSRWWGLAFFTSLLLWAAPADTTDIDWWTVDGGGGRSAGSGFALTGTVAQLDAGQPMSGGDFTFAGGLWTGDPSPAEPPLFADDFETGDLSRWSASAGSTKTATTGRSPEENQGEN